MLELGESWGLISPHVVIYLVYKSRYERDPNASIWRISKSFLWIHHLSNTCMKNAVPIIQSTSIISPALTTCLTSEVRQLRPPPHCPGI